jgi:nuclear cap-binding protein subunit 1
LDLPKWSPQRVFAQEVLEKEVRLSYWDKIKESLENAPALEELLPPKGGICFKYSGESQGEQSEAELALSAELSGMVKEKLALEMYPWEEEKIISVHGHKVSIEVVDPTLLHVGSKSFTHLVTVLERYGYVLTKLASEQPNQILVIAEVAKLWKK